MNGSGLAVICTNWMEPCESAATTTAAAAAAASLLTPTVYLLNESTITEFNRCDSRHMSTFNCTANDMLLFERGDSVADLRITIPLTIVYLIILLAGITGNALVCIIIIQNQLMHTNTNFYLFNLSVADLLYMLFGLPFEIHMFWYQYPWPFGETFCKFRSFATETCSYASVLTIVAFSVERYIAICHPLYSYVMANFKRVIGVIALIWCISLASASPVAYYRYMRYIFFPPDTDNKMTESGICVMNSNVKGLYEASTLVFFVIPLLILIVMYVCIAKKLKSRVQHRINEHFAKYSVGAASKQLKMHSSIIRMLIAIVITFFICWAPFHAQRLVFIYGQHWPNYYDINEFLFTSAGCFYYLSCAINPIIYNVMSHRYRTAFHQTFCCCFKKTYRKDHAPRTKNINIDI